MPQLDETGHVEIIVPECPYCGEPLDGPIAGEMHAECAEKFETEWDYFNNLVEITE